jgi:hypothetical protein
MVMEGAAEALRASEQVARAYLGMAHEGPGHEANS